MDTFFQSDGVDDLRRSGGKWEDMPVSSMRQERSATERALAESNERYRSLFAYHPHAAFSLDPEGRFTNTNDVTQGLSGYSLAEFSGMDFTQLICDDDLPAAIDAFERALAREPQQLGSTMWHADGHVIELMITVVPVVVDDEVVGVHGIAEDVTERNEMRRELERTRRLAQEASEAKSLFLANMSHEVRTPLTSVLGAAELLAEDGLTSHQHLMVQLIHRSGQRLLRLVNDILDFSRIEAGKVEVQVETVELRTLVREAVDWATPLAERKQLEFSTSVDPTLPETILGDPMRLSQVVTNLLGNAFKFTEHGQVQLLVEPAGADKVRFTVVDSGIGISADDLDSLFHSFTQVDASTTRRHGGAGLGLAISQQLAELMGGSLDASSIPGEGSAFSFMVPLQPVRTRDV
jgi:PAS domain S-box-containing protein